MRWFQEYRRFRTGGAHAFLFVGATGDMFPREGTAPDDPADALDPFADAFARRLPDNVVAWQFDAVRGFQFPRATDRPAFDALYQKAFPVPAVSDPIAAAAHKRAVAVLPAQPEEALSLMMHVFGAAAKETPAKPCVAVLADADVCCRPDSGSGSGESRRLALAIEQFAASDAFRRAGHALVLSSPSVVAVDERLRRADSGVCVIELSRPTYDERLAFLGTLYRDDAGLVAELEERCRALGEFVEAALAGARARKGANDEQTRAHAATDHVEADAEVVWLRAQLASAELVLRARLSEGEAALQSVRSVLESEQDGIRRRLDTDSSVAVVPLDAATWSALGVGDVLSLGPTGQQAVLVRVLEVTDAGACLSEPLLRDDATAPPQRTRIDGKNYLFRWEGDEFVQRVQTTGEEVRNVVVGTRRPVERERLYARLAEIQTELNAIKPKNPSELPEDRARAELAERLKARRVAVSTDVAEKTRRLQAERKKIERLLADPSGEEITRAKAVVVEAEARLAAFRRVGAFRPPGTTLAELARLTQGFAYRDVVDLARRAEAFGTDLTANDVRAVRLDILRRSYGHLLDVIEPSYGFEGVGGYDEIKAYLFGVRDAMLSGDVRRVPMGMLLMGPPGTGKTAVAEAFAKECGMIFVKLRSQRSMWVGESERQMEETLRALRALAPCVVFRDEVDQEDSGRDSYQGDSGVSGRIRQAMMTFLSDPMIRGQVLVIGATNRPDLLDAALMRSGRSDVRIPMLMPDADMRAKVFRVMMARYGYPCEVTDFAAAAAQTEGLSGADIEVIARVAFEMARGAAITDESLAEAVDDFLPPARPDIERMSRLAIAATSSKRFLPKHIPAYAS